MQGCWNSRVHFPADVKGSVWAREQGPVLEDLERTLGPGRPGGREGKGPGAGVYSEHLKVPAGGIAFAS